MRTARLIRCSVRCGCRLSIFGEAFFLEVDRCEHEFYATAEEAKGPPRVGGQCSFSGLLRERPNRECVRLFTESRELL